MVTGLVRNPSQPDSLQHVAEAHKVFLMNAVNSRCSWPQNRFFQWWNWFCTN